MSQNNKNKEFRFSTYSEAALDLQRLNLVLAKLDLSNPKNMQHRSLLLQLMAKAADRLGEHKCAKRYRSLILQANKHKDLNQ